MEEIEEFWYKEDVTTMLNKTPTQVNFANIEVNYLKKVRARKERDSQENFKCNRWGYRCAREFLWGWIFAHMLLLASGLQWKMQLLKAFCVQKKNINNWIFMDFKSSDDLQWSIKNCKTSNKLTVNMPQIIIQGKLFKDEHFILWKRNDEKIKLPSLGQKRKKSPTSKSWKQIKQRMHYAEGQESMHILQKCWDNRQFWQVGLCCQGKKNQLGFTFLNGFVGSVCEGNESHSE